MLVAENGDMCGSRKFYERADGPNRVWLAEPGAIHRSCLAAVLGANFRIPGTVLPGVSQSGHMHISDLVHAKNSESAFLEKPFLRDIGFRRTSTSVVTLSDLSPALSACA